jgi:two-component system response regulator YesN
MKKQTFIGRVLRHIMRLPDRDFARLTTKQLAERFAVSRGHLSRLFHLECRMTLTTFIRRQKLLRAERLLLKNKQLSVRAVSAELGYSDCQYFIERFKEHWGETPARYRRLLEDSAAISLKKYHISPYSD